MGNVLVNDQSLSDIAGAIRSKLGVQTTYKPGQMAAAIENIPSGGDLTPYAIIEAFYPVGALCSATNGTTIIHARDASGKSLFAIPRPASLPETWTICTIYEGYTTNRSIIISNDDEYKIIRSFFTVNENDLKAFMRETSYCRLSNAVGDKERYSDRWSQRTSSEPLIFVGYTSSEGSYYGYGVISKSSRIPEQTYSSAGNLVKNQRCETITIGNNTFYWYQMSGQLQGSLTSIEYTTDGTAEHFTSDLYIRLFSTGNNAYELRVVAVSDEVSEEFENLCDLYALLP